MSVFFIAKNKEDLLMVNAYLKAVEKHIVAESTNLSATNYGRHIFNVKASEDIDGVSSVSSLAGYEILTEGTGSNSGTCLINLKNWDERKESATEIIEQFEQKAKESPGANIEFFQPPSIPGYGAAGGFELRLLLAQFSFSIHQRIIQHRGRGHKA